MQINDNRTRINRLIENGYTFDLEKYFSEGWDLFRKQPGPFVVYALVAGIILMAIGFIPIFGAIVSAVISPPLTAGLFLGARKIDLSGGAELNDFFKGFDHIVQLFLLSLISGVFITIGIVLLIIPGIWFAVAVGLSVPLVLFVKADFWEGITLSVKLVNKKWFNFFALVILLFLLNLVGTLVFFVGLLITIPLTYCITYSAYKDIVGFSDDGGEMNVEDHLVEETD